AVPEHGEAAHDRTREHGCTSDLDSWPGSECYPSACRLGNSFSAGESRARPRRTAPATATLPGRPTDNAPRPRPHSSPPIRDLGDLVQLTGSADTASAASRTARPGTIFRSPRLVCDPLPVPKLLAPAVKVNALPVLSAYTKVPAWSATASPPDDPDGSDAAVFQLPPARSQ